MKASKGEIDSEDEGSVDFGSGFDCPMWDGVFNYAACIAGATMTACDELCRGLADIVINWTGEWHHAHRDKASGYCYVNDIVLGILVLRKKFDRILYIDLDVHHGDGVQEAFETTKRVFTLSFHQYEPGFYPGSGGCEDCGFATGKGYAVNFPFKSGITGSQFVTYFKRITTLIIKTYKPQVCVIQCGGDVIAGDPLGGSNLYPKDLIECIQIVMQHNLPLILLGGGGYNFANTSRYWTEITAAVCQQELSDDIPDENDFFLEFGPDYTIQIEKRRMEDFNTEEYLDGCVNKIEENLKKYDVGSF
ncbi:histone deacetylase 8-like isoform X2 [Eupeodes corollae]|nr:histone deacetylase 8-like isoform X2 [Eupeodes corollae]